MSKRREIIRVENTLIKSIYRNTEKNLNQEIQISGWVRTLRVSKAFGFIEINDGSFFKGLQVVFEENLPNFQEIAKVNTGRFIDY